MVFKIDFKKACDSISWDHLFTIMEFMGCGCRWIDWIKAFLFSSRSLSLVNGSLLKDFHLHLDLRQDDHLSLLFFHDGDGRFTCHHGRCNYSWVVSWSLYLKWWSTDFSFILFWRWPFMGEWNEENMATFVTVLNCFYCVSGLKINLQKSNLFEIGVYFSVEHGRYCNSYGV